MRAYRVREAHPSNRLPTRVQECHGVAPRNNFSAPSPGNDLPYFYLSRDRLGYKNLEVLHPIKSLYQTHMATEQSAIIAAMPSPPAITRVYHNTPLRPIRQETHRSLYERHFASGSESCHRHEFMNIPAMCSI